MIRSCRKCGGAPRPIKTSEGFCIVCGNSACDASNDPTKPFFTLPFAYMYWNRKQSIGSDFEIIESEEETNEGIKRKTN